MSFRYLKEKLKNLNEFHALHGSAFILTTTCVIYCDLLSHCMQMPKVILNLGLNLEFVYIDDILDVVTAL